MAFQKFGSLVERVNSTATSGGTLTLANNSQTYQQFTGTNTHTVVLPQANAASPNECPVGLTFTILNRSTGAITVNYNGGSLASTVAAGTQTTFRLTDNSTSTGSWDITNEVGTGSTSITLTTAETIAEGAAIAQGFYEDPNWEANLIKLHPEEIGGNYLLTKSPIPRNTASAGSFVLNGLYYLNGGWGSSSFPGYADGKKYNLDTDYWLSIGSKNTARLGSVGDVIGGFGWDAGGYLTSITYSAALEQYSDTTGIWTVKTSMPSALAAGGGCSTSNYFYSLMGDNGNATANYAYDFANNVWYTRQSSQNGGGEMTMLPFDKGSFNIAGLLTSGASQNFHVKYVESLNSFLSQTTLLGARSGSSGGVVNGLGYMFGSGTTPQTNVDEFNPTSGTWVSKVPLSSGRLNWSGHGTKGSLNGFGLAPGGDTSSNNTGMTNINQLWVNTSFIQIPIVKRSDTAPSAIFASVSLNSMALTLPARLRTDRDNWKYITANVDSAVKTGETLKYKFLRSNQIYNATAYNGSSAISNQDQYLIVTDSWTSRAAHPVSDIYQTCGTSVDGIAYMFGGDNTSGSIFYSATYAYTDTVNSWVNKSSPSPVAFKVGVGGMLNGLAYYVIPSNTLYSSDGVLRFMQYNTTSNTHTAKAVTTNDSRSGWMFNQSGLIWHFGGSNASNTPTGVMVVYSDVTNSWATKTTAPGAKYTGGGCVLNGKNYVFGGDNGGGQTNATYSYSPQTDSWTTEGNMTQSQYGISGYSAEGYGYALGGYNGSVTGMFSQFNPAASLWTNKTNPGTRYFPSNGYTCAPYFNYEVQVGIPTYLAALGGYQYVTKANSINSAGSPVVFSGVSKSYFLNGLSSQVYDSQLNSWMLSTVYPGGNVGGSGFSLLGRAYFNDNSSTTYAFDPVLSTWASVGASSSARNRKGQGNSVSLNGFGHIVGGSNPGNSSWFTTGERYSTASNSWTSTGTLNTVQNSNEAAGFILNGYWFIFGGYGNTFPSNTANIEKFSDAVNVWTTKNNYPINTIDTVGVNLNQSGLCLGLGGYNGSTFSTVYRYLETSDSWIAQANYPQSYSFGNASFDGVVIDSQTTNIYQIIPAIKNIVLGAALKVT